MSLVGDNHSTRLARLGYSVAGGDLRQAGAFPGSPAVTPSQGHFSPLFACWEMKMATRWQHNLDTLFICSLWGRGGLSLKPAALGLSRTFPSCSDLRCFGVDGQDSHSSVYLRKQSEASSLTSCWDPLRAQLPKRLLHRATWCHPSELRACLLAKGTFAGPFQSWVVDPHTGRKACRL